MNLPNKLTILRVLMIPVIVVCLYLPGDSYRIAAIVFFILACLTDFFDGYLARSRQLITDFGKFLDPVADKLLVLSTMIMLVHLQLLPAWVVIIVLARELSVDGLRMVAAARNTVIAAGKSGKIKTTFQMILIISLLVFRLPAFSVWPLSVLTILVLILTLYSGAEYFHKNSALLSLK